jgi:hypothetical protein
MCATRTVHFSHYTFFSLFPPKLIVFHVLYVQIVQRFQFWRTMLYSTFVKHMYNTDQFCTIYIYFVFNYTLHHIIMHNNCTVFYTILDPGIAASDMVFEPDHTISSSLAVPPAAASAGALAGRLGRSGLPGAGWRHSGSWRRDNFELKY